MLRLLATFCLLFALVSARAAETVIPVATGDWPPFVAEDLPGHGPVAQVVTAVLAEMGAKPRFIFTSWPLAEKMVESGSAFAAFPYTMTAERLQRFDYSASLFDTRSVIFFDKTRRPPNFAPRQVADLEGLTVGAIHGEWFVPELQQAGIAVDFANNYEQTLAKLMAGRVDVAPMNERLGWYYLRKQFPSLVGRVGAVPHFQSGPTLTNHLIVSRRYAGADKLLAELNAAIGRLHQRGEIERLLNAGGL